MSGLSVWNLCVGCMKQNESSEDWLIKNFGAFRVMARLQDFSTLNMVFSGVSHLFSSRFTELTDLRVGIV